MSPIMVSSIGRCRSVCVRDSRAAAKTQRAEEWFWRLVFVGVVCDFLYLGWLALKLLRAK